jgi:CheY-like chemotaxis protein
LSQDWPEPDQLWGPKKMPVQRFDEQAIAPSALPRIMVVDDNLDLVSSTAVLLRGWGYDVVEAIGGAQAIQKASEQNPDVILLDLGMPGITGLDVAREIRRHSSGNRPILIAHTSHSRALHQQLTMDAGFNLLVTKPVHPDHLKSLLDRFQ